MPEVETVEYEVELRGTITRDIKRVIANATDEDDVRAMCAEEYPTYRVHQITQRVEG